MWYVVEQSSDGGKIISQHTSYQEAYAESFRLSKTTSLLYMLYNEADAQSDGLLDAWKLAA